MVARTFYYTTLLFHVRICLCFSSALRCHSVCMCVHVYCCSLTKSFRIDVNEDGKEMDIVQFNWGFPYAYGHGPSEQNMCVLFSSCFAYRRYNVELIKLCNSLICFSLPSLAICPSWESERILCFISKKKMCERHFWHYNTECTNHVSCNIVTWNTAAEVLTGHVFCHTFEHTHIRTQKPYDITCIQTRLLCTNTHKRTYLEFSHDEWTGASASR